MDKDLAKSLLKKTINDYNSIASRYSEIREGAWPEFDFLFDCINPNDKVLDLGCGNGRFYPKIVERKAEYFGIDPSNKLIKIAKKNHKQGNFLASSFCEIPFADNYFNAIYSIAVLHHIPSKEFQMKLLKEIRRALKQKGYLILTVWDVKEKGAKKISKNDFLLKWYGAEDVYFHKFSLNELEGLAKEAEFEIIKKGEILVGKKPYNNFYIILRR